MKNKFRRVKEHAMLAGVLGGLAYMLAAPAWLVRTLFVLFTLGTGGTLILVYILVALFAPQWDTDPVDYQELCE